MQNVSEAAWIAGTHVDPQRDIQFTVGPMDDLENASNLPAYGSKMGIDATRKWPGEGFTREWPTRLKTTRGREPQGGRAAEVDREGKVAWPRLSTDLVGQGRSRRAAVRCGCRCARDDPRHYRARNAGDRRSPQASWDDVTLCAWPDLQRRRRRTRRRKQRPGRSDGGERSDLPDACDSRAAAVAVDESPRHCRQDDARSRLSVSSSSASFPKVCRWCSAR